MKPYAQLPVTFRFKPSAPVQNKGFKANKSYKDTDTRSRASAPAAAEPKSDDEDEEDG